MEQENGTNFRKTAERSIDLCPSVFNHKIGSFLYFYA